MDHHLEFCLGEWQVIPLRGVLHGSAGTRRLTPKSMDVLLCLARNQGQVVSRETLIKEVWGDRAVSDEPINKCIAELRRQLGDNRASPSYIETITKRGYRLIADYRPIGNSELQLADNVLNTKQRMAQPWSFLISAGVLLVLVATLYLGINQRQAKKNYTIAVLPFEVLSSLETKEYFADGIHEELIGELSFNKSLSVRSRTSTIGYRNSSKSLTDIARELDAEILVEGSVRQEGDRVRVTAQLIDAVADAHLWTGNYDATLTVVELFAIQSRIAREIATALELTLTKSEASVEAPTSNIAAYDHFMLGKYHYRRQLPGDIQLSVKNFETAVALDPRFADAWDWLAYGYNHAATQIGYLSPAEAYPKARTAALRALEIEPDLATAVSILGYIRAVFDWDWAGAEADLRRAIQLNPNDSGTVWSLAHVLSILNRHDEAVALTQEFADKNKTLGRNDREVALRLIDAGKFEDALVALDRARAAGDEPAQIESTAGVAYFGLGAYDKAITSLEYAADAMQRAPLVVARLAHVYGQHNRAADGRRLVEELRARQDRVAVIVFAIAQVGLGDVEPALDNLEKAADDRDRAILGLAMDPFFSSIRDQPRVNALIRSFAIPKP